MKKNRKKTRLSHLPLPIFDEQDGESYDSLLLTDTTKVKVSSNGHQITFDNLWKLNPEIVRDVGDRVGSWNSIQKDMHSLITVIVEPAKFSHL